MMHELNQSALLPNSDINVADAISKYTKHDLSDLKNSELMDRVDSKFLLPVDTLSHILASCNNFYSVLTIDDVNLFQYNNIYFDTANLDFYRSHHNRKLNRYKVRHRNYADVGSSFLEVKFKNNKGRTIKTRCASDDKPSAALISNARFLDSNGIEQSNSLIASQSCNYQRISLANDAQHERLTLDLNVNFINQLNNSNFENSYILSNFYIAELKQEKLNRQSPFYRLIREMAIRSKGFSKYCMGVSLTNNKHIKTNRFKANLMRLERGA